MTREVMDAGSANGWGDPRELKVSFDGGLSWTGTGNIFTGPDVSFDDPADASIIFASNCRSADGGTSWQPMIGCRVVYAADRATGTLCGNGARSPTGATIVRSVDHGMSWNVVAEQSAAIADLAVLPGGSRVWAMTDGRLRELD